MIRLPAEWEAQDAVLLTWPHKHSDWAPMLDQVCNLYQQLIIELVAFCEVILVVPPELHAAIEQELHEALSDQAKRVHLYPINSNDTWARDFGPITVFRDELPLLQDFCFNAWGNKFAAGLDNAINSALKEQGAFASTALQSHNFILEGGAIESDGEGCILTTSQCLLNPNRNPDLSKAEVEAYLAEHLGATKVLWLEHGYLAGDDTDSHIDTLARFAPGRRIVYVRCDEKEDEHFIALSAMEKELQALRHKDGSPFTLCPLPWPKACYGEEGERLPATYANFLIVNQALIMPCYGDEKNDALAKACLQEAFPDYKIIGLNCLPLIQQHGSLHCITMQIPHGVLHSINR